MKAATLERWTWVLLYGGLLLLSLGIFVFRRDAAVGTGLQIVGALGAAAGVLMIWLRSRIDGEAGE